MRERGKNGKDERDERQAKEQAVRREPARRVMAREPKLLIVGAPGEGKSTLLRRTLLQAAARWREQPAAEPFPVLVKLSDWEAEEGPCEGRLIAYLQSRLPKMGEIGSQAIAAWLKRPMLWLLDGIDEVRDPGERGRFAAEVQAVCLRPNDRWVISTRPAGEPRGGLGAGWTRAVLPSLSDPQIEQVLARWEAVLAKKEGLQLDARRVAADLKGDAGLRQVRGNALLLTLAVLFFKTRKRLPHDRWEFYAAADASLCDTWAAHRIREAQRYLPGDYLPELLDRLALEGMIEGRVLFDRTMLKETAKAVLAARGYTGREQDTEADRFVAAAEDLIGVLVAQAPDRFGFLHLTFEEFYAARAVAKKGEKERTALIAHYWDHPDWREVWPLYALAVQNELAKYQHLFATILASGNALDDCLFRPQFACLRLAGVGSAPLPVTTALVTGWALDALKEREWVLLPIFGVLCAWERRFSDDLAAVILARLGDDDGFARRAAVQTLAAAVDELEVRAALLGRLADDDALVRQATAEVLAAAVNGVEVSAALLKRLADDDWLVRAAAEPALSATGVAVRADLRARLAGDSQEPVAAKVATVDDEKTRSTLLVRVADNDWLVRMFTVREARSTMSEAEVRTVVLARLADDEAHVRAAAAEVLAAAVSEAEVGAAILTLLTDDSEFVRVAAVQALTAATGERKIHAALQERMNDRAWQMQGAAARALAAWIVAEKFGLPVADVVPVYP
ncbi:MAG: HEAT repeat domain-containing protein [Rhodospirillales bacterium]|nr:HEAT repeat domain-containing protein [Rhodospirillales bacterium]